MVSKCCGAHMEGEPYTGFHPSTVWGMCSKCKEHSSFYEEEDVIRCHDPGDENASSE